MGTLSNRNSRKETVQDGWDSIANVNCLLVIRNEFEREGLRGILGNRGVKSIEAIASFDEGFDSVLNRIPDVVVIANSEPPADQFDEFQNIRLLMPDSQFIFACEPSAVRTYLSFLAASDVTSDPSAKLILCSTFGDGDRMLDIIDEAFRHVVSIEKDIFELLVRGQFGRSQSLLELLSPQEYLAVELLSSGAANKHIADQLQISSSSAGNMLTKVFTKMGLPENDSLNRRVMACREFLSENRRDFSTA